MNTQLDYGNWIRKKNLVILGVCALGAGALLLVPFGGLYQSAVAILFAILLVSFLFPLYAYVMFSQSGGRLQEKIYDLVIESLGSNVQGKIIDIGCGNGVLAVKLAQRFRATQVVGVDYWGKDWEYSKSICEKNAQIAQVQSRVEFQKGDAAALDFADETFDAATSNLTFHEVKSVRDKKDVVRKALRVVKPGGAFAFVDYFFDEKYYGKQSDLDKFLRDLQLANFEYKPLQDLIAIPVLLRHPKILGKVGILYGIK